MVQLGVAFKNVWLPNGDRLFAGRYVGLFTGVGGRKVFLEKTAELMRIPLGNKDFPLVVDDLYGQMDTGVEGLRHRLQGFFGNDGI